MNDADWALVSTQATAQPTGARPRLHSWEPSSQSSFCWWKVWLLFRQSLAVCLGQSLAQPLPRSQWTSTALPGTKHQAGVLFAFPFYWKAPLGIMEPRDLTRSFHYWHPRTIVQQVSALTTKEATQLLLEYRITAWAVEKLVLFCRHLTWAMLNVEWQYSQASTQYRQASKLLHLNVSIYYFHLFIVCLLKQQAHKLNPQMSLAI